MAWLSEFARRIQMLLRGSRFDRDMQEEMRLHRELRERDLRAAGLSPADARSAAHRQFGNETLLREVSGDAWGWRWLEHLAQDIAFSLRQLRLNPGFAAAAILSLALGIGANTAIFQLLNAVRLRTLPVANPQEIVEIRLPSLSGASGGFYTWNPQITNPQWEQIRQHQEPFNGVFAWAPVRFNVAQGGEARNVTGISVSGGYFRVLGVGPHIGRVLSEADDQRGCGDPAAVLSYAYWQREYGGDPAIIGRALTLDNQVADIVGVTPPSFFGVEPGRSFDVAVPLCSEALLRGENSRLDQRSAWWLTVMARLKPGVSIERATAYLQSISPALFEATLPEGYGEDDRKAFLGFKLGAFPAGAGVSALREQYENSLWLLLGIAGLVLMIACANLANLMLARASAREREFAVRMALGASRGRLIRQLLSESLLIAAMGAALGALLAGNLSAALVSFLSTGRSRWILDLAGDWRVFAFTAALAVLTCILFGLTPALKATRSGPGEALQAGSRGLTAGRERFALRRALVVTQVALSLVLVVGAFLFARSFQMLVTQDAGLRQDGILVAEVDFSPLRLPPERRLDFTRSLLDRMRAIPGVASAATATMIPLSGSGWNQWVWMEGQALQQKTLVWFNRVSDGYFSTIGMRLLAGRDFDARDSLSASSVAIVNETFARRYNLGPNPVGLRFHMDQSAGVPIRTFEIIGLVSDAKYESLRDEVVASAYLPAWQEPRPGLDATLLVRSAVPLESVTGEVKRLLVETSPQIGVDFLMLRSIIDSRLLQERLMATLSGFFGALATLLAAIGLYGVISYMVARRRNEIGIRMALGARPGNVLALILREAGVLVALGLAVGTLLALGAGRAVSSMLYGLQPYDAAVMTVAVLLLALIALAASYLPARRATRLDPLSTLRQD